MKTRAGKTAASSDTMAKGWIPKLVLLGITAISLYLVANAIAYYHTRRRLRDHGIGTYAVLTPMRVADRSVLYSSRIQRAPLGNRRDYTYSLSFDGHSRSCSSTVPPIRDSRWPVVYMQGDPESAALGDMGEKVGQLRARLASTMCFSIQMVILVAIAVVCVVLFFRTVRSRHDAGNHP